MDPKSLESKGVVGASWQTLGNSSWLRIQLLSNSLKDQKPGLNKPLFSDCPGFPDKFIRQSCRTRLKVAFFWFSATLMAKLYIISEENKSYKENIDLL